MKRLMLLQIVMNQLHVDIIQILKNYLQCKAQVQLYSSNELMSIAVYPNLSPESDQ